MTSHGTQLVFEAHLSEESGSAGHVTERVNLPPDLRSCTEVIQQPQMSHCHLINDRVERRHTLVVLDPTT